MRNEQFIQIIRGLPGSGKSTLARKFDCLHVEQDMFCLRGRRYIWTPCEDGFAHWLMMDYLRRAVDDGIDVVVTGVFADGRDVAHVIDMAYNASKRSGRPITVYVRTLTRIGKDVHCVRRCDMDAMRAAFVPMAEYGISVRHYLADGSTPEAVVWEGRHVHYDALMPLSAEVVPYAGSAR